MKRAYVLISTFLLAAQHVAAHGYVKTVTIAGTPYQADYPFTDEADSPPSGIRHVFDVVPIKGAQNPDIQCGIKAQPASLVLSANAGDEMTFDWRGADDSFWPHNTGPLLSYMASCGSTTCDKFDMTKAKWFKIEQTGQKPDGSTWYQADLMTGAVASATIPKNIAPGQYLLRHEIIALHLATAMGGAEFYESCTQLNVSGSGTGAPSPSELVSFPGAYSDNDPGIFTPNVFDSGFQYDFPGPPVSQLAATSSGNGTTSGTSSQPSAGSTSHRGTCRLRKPGGSIQRRNFARLRELFIGSKRH